MDKSTFLINMGRRIAKARKDVGLSQASLAEKADISEIHMSNIERGKKNPSADVLCRISEIGHTVPRAMLPDSISMDSIKNAMKTCIETKKDTLLELLGVELNEEYLY